MSELSAVCSPASPSSSTGPAPSPTRTRPRSPAPANCTTSARRGTTSGRRCGSRGSSWGYGHLLIIKPALNFTEWVTETPLRFLGAVILAVVIWHWS